MTQHTVESIRDGLLRKTFSAVEFTREALAHAERENPKTNAYLLLAPERALKSAELVDEKIAAGHDPGPLAGVPVAVKDVIVTKDLRTTCGSKILANYIPPYNATAIDRIEAAGGIVIGKTNCDEFAMGSSNENSAFGPVRNPVAPDRVPGGSSGGSAAVVAQGTAVVSLGSDTGGSIRQPASFCGVVGVTPTYGRVSRYGLSAFASSLDHIGPFARNVRDAAALLEVIAGRDPLDSTSAAAPVPQYTAHLKAPVKGMKVGVPVEYMKHATGETAARVNEGIESLRALGCEIAEISLPSTDYAIACYYILATAEASSNLARYDGVRFTSRVDGEDLTALYENTRAAGFGAEVKRRVLIGTYVLSAGYYDAYYIRAQKVRALILRDFTEVFRDVDALVTPTAPSAAFAQGENMDDPVKMYLNDVFTGPANMSGIPGMSVPAGLDAAGLPLGLQVLGRPFDEETVFAVAAAIERAANFTALPGTRAGVAP